MGEQKVEGRRVVIALEITCVVFVATLVVAVAHIAWDQSVISKRDNTIASLNSQISSLNAQVSALEAPRLVKVNVLEDDNRLWPYLHVYGYICNVASNTAYNCRIHVVAYQSGGVVAIDTYIFIGYIYGYDWRYVDLNVYYSGSALTSWSITPQCTGWIP